MLTLGSTNSGHQAATVTKFCTRAPNICRYSEWNLLYVSLSGTYNFEVASTYLENLCTPVLTEAQVRSMDSRRHLHWAVKEQRMTFEHIC